MNKGLLIATIVLASALLAWSATTYAALPLQIPMHFSSRGVDRWAAKSVSTWLYLPILAIGLCAFNYVMGGLLARRPDLMSIPRKKRLLALPPERQQRVMRWFWVLVQTIGLVELFLMSIAQYGVWRAASARLNGGPVIVVLVTTIAVGMIPLSLFIIRQMSAEVERQESGGD
jgi:uncharacterized membrane protein